MQNDGDICVCNKNTESFKDKFRNTIYIHEQGLETAWNSHTRKMIAAGLDHGKRLPSCQSCWDDEDAGKVSNRQLFNKQFASTIPSKTQPRVLIIKPGNVCNLGCRMCQPSTSTSLYQDFYKLDTERKQFSGTFKEYTSSFENIRNGFRPDNDLVWPVLDKWANELEFIDVYGGEPLLSQELWQTLSTAVDVGNSKNIDIRFHTNATIWNQTYMDLLTKFKSVSVGLSVDAGQPDQLSYIRHKSNPDEIFANIEKYTALSKNYPSIEVRLVVTVSSYNIWNLLDIVNDLSKFNIPVGINLVYSPAHYDIRHLPGPVKNALIDKFEKTARFQHIANFLKQQLPGSDSEWSRFVEEFKILDKIRNQNFANTFPDWYNVLKPFV